MSTEIDDIRDIGEEEYIIMNLDSRQMETDGTSWFVKNMKGERGFDEPIPYVTSIELVDSYIPNTFYNVEEYNNVFAFGTQLEHYIINDSDPDKGTRTAYAINEDNKSLDEIPHFDENNTYTTPTFDREYAKINPIQSSNTLSTYAISHQVFFEDSNMFVIRFTINKQNTTLVNIHSFSIHVSNSSGNEIKRAVLDRSGYVDLLVGRMIQNDVGEWIKPQGVFDMYTSDDGIDDIPTDTHVKVFSHLRVEFPIQNYTSEQLMEVTNEYIHSHLRQIFDNRRDDIVRYMPYELFLDLHLKLDKNDRSKRFSFTSKHNHPFFIDLTESRSITQELGFSHAFYISGSNVTTYTQKMSTSDEISSITVKELRNINTNTNTNTFPNTMMFQAFNRMFFDNLTLPSDTELISKNLVTIEPVFVNDYPFKRGELEIFGNVVDTLISYYGVLLLSNTYYILPFKQSFYNIFSTNTNASQANILQKTDNAFYGVEYADFLNDKTFVDSFKYEINTQIIESENIINLSGERYVDMVCVEIQNELKRYNAGYNKLYRYYFDDISDLYVTSSKGNVTDLVLRNPRDFGPVARLNKLTIQFIRSDENPYDFKTIPFFVTIAIKYLKPVLRTEEVES
tara:strand:- start:10734 stop:12602 length:1869 start_codon:yes stop_codon:yes gene_type:complete